MSDYDDYSGDEGDLDWLYVEDHYDEADNLAEHTCPSPVYILNVAEDYDDYDAYDYWEDVAYLSDSYWDGNVSAENKRKAPEGTKKRGQKRRKLADQRDLRLMKEPTVVWVPHRARELAAQQAGEPAQKGPGKGFSLLGDWQERFKDVPGFETNIGDGSRDVYKMMANDSSELSEDEDDNNEEDDDDPTGPPKLSKGVTNLFGDLNNTSDGDFFKLDIRVVAKLISESGSMDQLKAMFAAQGLDPDVVDQAMKDLIENKELGEEVAEDEDETEAGPSGDLDGEGTPTHERDTESETETARVAPPVTNGDTRTDKTAASPHRKRTSPQTTKKTSPNKATKRTRAASPSDEDEPIATRSRKKRVNYSGMA